MGKKIFIGEKSINILKENLNEFVVDKNSDFTNPNEFWFILYRGDLLFFTYESRGLLDAFFERHENELKKWTDKYDNSKNLYSQFEFNNFIVRFGASVPHLITGRISNSDVYINENEEYDILNSNELYQLVKEHSNYTFYLGRKKIDTNLILNNKGKGKPKFWYHGTTIGNALKILKGGLRPTPSNTIYKMKHDKTVFLTSSFETARWYANNKTKRLYGMLTNQPCVIKIDGNHIDDGKIVYDYDVYNAHVVNKNDSVYNDSNLLYPNETNTIQKETDPKKYLKVGYRGVIMPSAILSIYEVDYTREEEYSVEDFVKKYTQESVNEAKPEVDEYEIGQESDNPPIGGNYCHVNENTSFDTSEIGGVNYSWDFDKDEYQEWLADMEYENNRETLMEYITDNVEFELEYLDNQTYHTFNREYVDYNTLEEMFGSKMQNEILKTCMNNGEGSFDVDELFSEDDVDINNQESINNIAMKLLRHGDYFKGCRGFILTNGIVVYTEMEHNEICRIPNVNDKLDFVRMGNIRILPQSIDIGARPTNEQREVLMQVINSYSNEELYLDIFEGKSSIGAKYTHPNWRFVMGEIDRYYNEGIKPQGNVQYEEKNKTILVSENQLKSIKENLDFEVNSSEIDLSSFKKKTSLAPNIWDENDILDSRIRLKLLDIADDFWNFVNLTWVKPKGIILTGSICNFNWSTYSDIDLHLIVDFNEIDEKTEFVKEYLDAKKNEWNNEHEDLKIFGYQVELYTQNIDEMPQSGGIYDLEQNEWIKKPSPNDIKAIALDKYPIKDKAAKIMTIIDDMYDTLSSTNDNHEIEEIGEDAKYLWKKIKSMRKQSLEKHGENGIGNICYKYMRRSGYLDKLWKLRTICYDKTNSINESKEVINENIDTFKLAKEHFGTTYDIRECGYILPSGEMLDFSGRHEITRPSDATHLNGQRAVDHRCIYEIGWDINKDTKLFDITMEDFIRQGAVRISPSNSWSTINLYVKPTKEQIDVISRLVRFSHGNVTVEIGDGNESLSYAEYDEAKPSRVIGEILRYFDEGVNLMGNVSESKKIFKNKTIKEYLTLLKKSSINEEIVADGSAEHNPYAKRWKAERKALKDFICNFGKIMTSRENGKQYKCYYDQTLSQLIGYNYCICLQWDPINLKPSSTLYIRALDKFTDRIFQAQYDDRGKDNVRGTYDDNFSQNY